MTRLLMWLGLHPRAFHDPNNDWLDQPIREVEPPSRGRMVAELAATAAATVILIAAAAVILA